MRRLLWIGNPFFCRSLRQCGWDAVATHNFETPQAYGWDDLCRLAGFTPDVLVVADKSRAPFVLGVEKGAELLKTYGADGLFVDEDHHVYLTEGMKERFSLLADSYSVEDIIE